MPAFASAGIDTSDGSCSSNVKTRTTGRSLIPLNGGIESPTWTVDWALRGAKATCTPGTEEYVRLSTWSALDLLTTRSCAEHVNVEPGTASANDTASFPSCPAVHVGELIASLALTVA